MRRRHLCISVLLLLLLVVAPAIRAEDEGGSAPAVFEAQRFYRDVRYLVRQHYPDATAHRLGNKIHFEHDTRIFIVHEALKTGEWQDPWEDRGPRKGGVYCDIEFRPGVYHGTYTAPQTFDKRYFKLHMLAPYSEKLDGHLYVCLKMPGRGRPPKGFQEELTALLNGLEVYAGAE